LLENTQTKSNAIRIIVEQGNISGGGTVWASLSPIGITASPNSTPMSSSNIMMKFNHYGSSAANNHASNEVFTEIPMTNYTDMSKLFDIDKNNGTYNYYYDVKLPALAYYYAPATYSYLFTFELRTNSGITTQSTISYTVTINEVIDFSISNSNVSFAFSRIDDYANGVSVLNATVCNIKSNISWLVNTQANATYFTPSGIGAASNMTCGILSLRRSGLTSWNQVSNTSNITLQTGNRTGALTPPTQFDVDIKSNPGFNYSGGIYTIGLVYTLTNL
jgi:hypothetical protein